MSRGYLEVNCCKLIFTTESIPSTPLRLFEKIASEKKERENRYSHFYNDNFKHENPTKETIIFPKPTTADYMSKFYREKL